MVEPTKKPSKAPSQWFSFWSNGASSAPRQPTSSPPSRTQIASSPSETGSATFRARAKNPSAQRQQPSISSRRPRPSPSAAPPKTSKKPEVSETQAPGTQRKNANNGVASGGNGAINANPPETPEKVDVKPPETREEGRVEPIMPPISDANKEENQTNLTGIPKPIRHETPTSTEDLAKLKAFSEEPKSDKSDNKAELDTPIDAAKHEGPKSGNLLNEANLYLPKSVKSSDETRLESLDEPKSPDESGLDVLQSGGSPNAAEQNVPNSEKSLDMIKLDVPESVTFPDDAKLDVPKPNALSDEDPSVDPKPDETHSRKEYYGKLSKQLDSQSNHELMELNKTNDSSPLKQNEGLSQASRNKPNPTTSQIPTELAPSPLPSKPDTKQLESHGTADQKSTISQQSGDASNSHRPHLNNISLSKNGRKGSTSCTATSAPRGDINGSLTSLVQKLGIGGETGTRKGICIITLAGENRGASMVIGQGGVVGAVPIFHKGRNLLDQTEDGKEEEEEVEENGAKKPAVCNASVNSNTQGVNNSILEDSCCHERDAGVHLVLATIPTEAENGDAHTRRSVTRRSHPFTVRSEEPEVRRRCLRALFLESDSDHGENPQRRRRHGCKYGLQGNQHLEM